MSSGVDPVKPDSRRYALGQIRNPHPSGPCRLHNLMRCSRLRCSTAYDSSANRMLDTRSNRNSRGQPHRGYLCVCVCDETFGRRRWRWQGMARQSRRRATAVGRGLNAAGGVVVYLTVCGSLLRSIERAEATAIAFGRKARSRPGGAPAHPLRESGVPDTIAVAAAWTAGGSSAARWLPSM